LIGRHLPFPLRGPLFLLLFGRVSFSAYLPQKNPTAFPWRCPPTFFSPCFPPPPSALRLTGLMCFFQFPGSFCSNFAVFTLPVATTVFFFSYIFCRVLDGGLFFSLFFLRCFFFFLCYLAFPRTVLDLFGVFVFVNPFFDKAC